ncbi:glycosyltransferase family 4 protein [Dolichospermum compactum]|uniref:Putative glycosyltransferase n=1 Tax=Dolichospermum compactum NIES-806 TaxID=1973481 RepID=A0A1Z4V8F8_9CYAN|nr:glycosyltransferase family 1 protein [Dolichospermum compactum]BAZ87861.1 putative glycosyltransferase [Dolichospermum compactum NIES-806]
MHILYDGEIYGAQKVGGISRYFDNIISRLPQDFEPILTSPRSRNEPHPHHPNLKIFNYKRFGFKPGRVSYWLEKYYFRAVEATTNNPQIFHPTYYSLLTHQEFQERRCPIILTVYDMIHEIFPHLIDKQGQFAEIKRRAILASDIILCISKSTKNDLLERYPLPENRVLITHLATEFNPSLEENNDFIPSRPFFLYVGSRGTYKNFNNLLIALAKIGSKIPDVLLCVVGSPFDSTEKEQISKLNLDNHIENFSYASDAHLAKLYRNCVAFVYPSLYEGFGIPLLEAMICQAPIIASNTSSFPEVVGDAGLLFDPTSVADLADRLLFMLDNPAERDILITKGLERVKHFSWDKTAAQTVEAYRSVLR